jgi:hypothetical protein
MLKLILPFLIFMHLSGVGGLEIDSNTTTDYIGHTPEIVVTAPRYEYEDIAWSGQMKEIIVTAPRYDNKESMAVGIDNGTNQNIMNTQDNDHAFKIVDIGNDNHNIYTISLMLLVTIFIVGFYLRTHFRRRHPKLATCECDSKNN